MSSRDRGEKLTKEGAARVCMYKMCGIIHSYTLECGLHYTTIQPPETTGTSDDHTSSTATFKGASTLSSTSQSKSLTKAFANVQNLGSGSGFRTFKASSSNTIIVNKKPEDAEKMDEGEQQQPPPPPKYYSVESYENLGKAILVSILDIFEKNPLTLTKKVAQGGIPEIRKQIAGSLYKMMRFRKEGKLAVKYKQINEFVHKKFYEDFHKKKVFEKQPNSTTYNHSATIQVNSSYNKQDEGISSYKSLTKTITVRESQSEHPTNRNYQVNRKEVFRLRGRKYIEYGNHTSEEEHEEGEYGQEEDEEGSEEDEEAEAGNYESSQERYFGKKINNKSPAHQTTDDELPVSKWVSEAAVKMKVSKQTYRAETHQAMLALNDSQATLKESFLPAAVGNKRMSDYKIDKPALTTIEDGEAQEKRFNYTLHKM